jgi:hypothetical protein
MRAVLPVFWNPKSAPAIWRILCSKEQGRGQYSISRSLESHMLKRDKYLQVVYACELPSVLLWNI